MNKVFLTKFEDLIDKMVIYISLIYTYRFSRLAPESPSETRQSRLKSVILLNLSELFKIKNRIVEEVLFSHLFLLTKEKYYKSLTF